MRKCFLMIFLAVSINIFAQEIKPVRTIDDLESIMNSNNGKVTLYNFWATWCKPCVQEFPELVKLYMDYKEKGFELVFISVDMPEQIQEKVVPFLKKQNVSFTTYYNDFKTIDDFINYYDKQWEGAIPSTYIYNKEGKLVSKFLGNKDYDFFEKEIKKYLN